mmetsp:Transcript_66309/g.158635  ORF Transcript_66309/g.158635 Transcript_66309/m.158635 type:complete len:201 (-) Transcript_66309:642-1244(-)
MKAQASLHLPQAQSKSSPSGSLRITRGTLSSASVTSASLGPLRILRLVLMLASLSALPRLQIANPTTVAVTVSPSTLSIRSVGTCHLVVPASTPCASRSQLIWSAVSAPCSGDGGQQTVAFLPQTMAASLTFWLRKASTTAANGAVSAATAGTLRRAITPVGRNSATARTSLSFRAAAAPHPRQRPRQTLRVAAAAVLGV